MDRKEQLVQKAGLALKDPFLVELVKRAMVAQPGNFVGIVKKVCEILELEDRIAASVRYAAILARDFPAEFQKLTTKEVKMESRNTGLFLKRGQIHVGMILALAREGKNEPDVDEKGDLRLVELESGGISARTIRVLAVDREPTNKVKTIGNLDDFNPETRFMPIHVFSPEEAPVLTEYVVFLNGERCVYPQPDDRETLYVFKDEKGRFISTNSYAYGWWLKEIPMDFPEGILVKLVPISKIGKAQLPNSTLSVRVPIRNRGPNTR